MSIAKKAIVWYNKRVEEKAKEFYSLVYYDIISIIKKGEKTKLDRRKVN